MHPLESPVCAGHEGAQQFCFQCFWSSGYNSLGGKAHMVLLFCDFITAEISLKLRPLMCQIVSLKLRSLMCQQSAGALLPICLHIF